MCHTSVDFQCVHGWGKEEIKMGMGRMEVRREGNGDYVASCMLRTMFCVLNRKRI